MQPQDGGGLHHRIELNIYISCTESHFNNHEHQCLCETKIQKLDEATSLFRPLSRDNGSSRRRPCGVDPAERKDSLERLIDFRNICAKLECPKKSTDNQLLMRRNKLPCSVFPESN